MWKGASVDMTERLRRYRRDVLAPWAGLGEPRRLSLYRGVGIEIGARTRLGPGLRFRDGDVRIGRDCFVNAGVVFDPGSASIVIEDGVAIGVDTVLAAAGHHVGPPERRAEGHLARSILIGRGAWLGARVIVLSGVTVAPGCIVGAGAVVTKDTEPDGVYAGVPARRVRDLPTSPALDCAPVQEQRRP